MKKVLHFDLSSIYYEVSSTEEDRAMTIKEFINKAMDMATILLNKGDHEGYQKIMAIIADEIATAHGF